MDDRTIRHPSYFLFISNILCLWLPGKAADCKEYQQRDAEHTECAEPHAQSYICRHSAQLAAWHGADHRLGVGHGVEYLVSSLASIVEVHRIGLIEAELRVGLTAQAAAAAGLYHLRAVHVAEVAVRVGDDEAVEAPFVTQHAGEQIVAAAAIAAMILLVVERKVLDEGVDAVPLYRVIASEGGEMLREAFVVETSISIAADVGYMVIHAVAVRLQTLYT